MRIARLKLATSAVALLLAASGPLAAATFDFEPPPDAAGAPLLNPEREPTTGALPGSLDGDLRKASDLLASGNASEAEKIARQVAVNQPENADAWFLLGLALANLDRLPEALEPLGRAADLYKVNAAPLVVRGDIFATLGKADEAKAAYLAAVERDPTNWAAQESLGVIAEAAGETDLAAERYAKASATAPGNRLFPRLQLARLALLGDDPDLAISVLAPIASTGVTNDRLFDLLARAYIAKGEPEVAQRFLDKLVQGGQSLFGYVGLARIALSDGNGDEALRLLETARKTWPDDAALTLEYANVLAALGRYDEALALYDALRATDPGDLAVLRPRGLTLSRLGRLPEALETASQITADPAATSNDFVWLATLQEASGNSAAAQAAYETAMARDGGNWVAMNNLANLLSTTDPARAVDLATQAATLAPDVPAIRETVAWTSLKAGETERAATLYAELLAADPDNALLLYRSGLVRLAQGDVAEGKRLIAAALAADPAFRYADEANAQLQGN